MNATEKVINDLNVAKYILINPQMLNPEMCIRIGQAITSAINMLTEQSEIVRCGDCKYYSNGFCYNPNTFDEKTCGNTVPDWFCADGKRWC